MGNRFREKEVEEGLEEPVREAQPAADAEPTPAESAAAEPTASRRGGVLRGVGRVLGGDLLADKMVVRQIPLLLLCLFYVLLIVGNRYRIENLSREKLAAEERINFLREERIQMQRQYQQSVKISQIAADLKERGVGITAGPPYEIQRFR